MTAANENERLSRVEWDSYPMVRRVVSLVELGGKSGFGQARRGGGDTSPPLRLLWLWLSKFGQTAVSWRIVECFARRIILVLSFLLAAKDDFVARGTCLLG